MSDINRLMTIKRNTPEIHIHDFREMLEGRLSYETRISGKDAWHYVQLSRSPLASNAEAERQISHTITFYEGQDNYTARWVYDYVRDRLVITRHTQGGAYTDRAEKLRHNIDARLQSLHELKYAFLHKGHEFERIRPRQKAAADIERENDKRLIGEMAGEIERLKGCIRSIKETVNKITT